MAIELLMPALSPTMEEGTLAKWLVKEGDSITSGDVIAEIETDKAIMEFEAVDEGIMGKIIVTEGTSGIPVNAPIAIILEDGEEPSAADAVKPALEKLAPVDTPKTAEPTPTAVIMASAPKANKGDRVFASPLARRIAADKGLDLENITGSGPHGRIIKNDVENAPLKAITTAIKLPQSNSIDQIKAAYADREFLEVPLDGMRKIIAERLTEAKQTIPHFYLRRGIKLDNLLEFRAQINKQLEPRGVKLSVNDFIIKASAIALQEVPDCNAIWANDRIIKFTASDVAVAVAVEGGLFTPVIRDADTKSLSVISAEMKDLATRARERKLAPHDYQGGSFAISNLGMMGIENFDAVINPPHGSILAVGAGIKKPVVGTDDQIEVATVMSVTLSVDHRVIDGALGAQFLAALKESLENPIAMLA